VGGVVKITKRCKKAFNAVGAFPWTRIESVVGDSEKQKISTLSLLFQIIDGVPICIVFYDKIDFILHKQIRNAEFQEIFVLLN